MAWLNVIGKQWFPWLEISLPLQNFLPLFGFMQFVMELKYAIIFHLNSKMAYILHLLN
jgi:hypothetical protein